MKKIFFYSLLCLFLSACTSSFHNLQQGENDFKQGDYHKAYVILKPYAEQGNADAQYALGYLLFYGLGTTQDLNAGKEWMQKAADQNQQNAQIALAELEKKSFETQSPVFSTLPNHHPGTEPPIIVK